MNKSLVVTVVAAFAAFSTPFVATCRAADDAAPATAPETAPAAAVAPTAAEATAERRTLSGGFEWTDGDATGDLQAIFTAAGTNSWTVDFKFDFREEAHVYSGTATGDLTKGKLSGSVLSDGTNKRPFTFSGEFDETGNFKGTHASQKDGAAVPTGSLHLRAAAR